MANYLVTIKKDFRLRIGALIADIKALRDKEYFRPNGVQMYTGKQGSGKTITAVKHTRMLMERYPKAILVSNLLLAGALHISTEGRDVTMATQEVRAFKPSRSQRFAYLYFSSAEELHRVLTGVNNEKYGVIYLIDEIHTYFNAVNSKETPMHVFTEISQQRKQHKLVIGTSQLFMRLEKAIREQCDNIVVCRTIGGIFTLTKAYDGMSIEQDYNGKLTGQMNKSGFYFHTVEDRAAYDTFQKVVSSQMQYEAANRPVTFIEPKRSVFGRK